MQTMLAPLTHILPLTTFTRARLLPDNGVVLVKQGERVNALDVVAEMPAGNRHMIIDAWQTLKPGQKESGTGLIKRKAGEFLKKGDVIAETEGLFSRVVRAASDCRIVAVGGNQIMLELDGGKVELKAAYSGTVRDIISDRGVLIQSSGALIQGVWGNDRLNMGVLVNKTHNSGDLLTRDWLDESVCNTVVLAGHCDRADTLLAARDLPINGLILGSMTADLVPIALKAEFPIILLEGFGSQPVNSSAYRLLVTSEKRNICVNAFAPDGFLGVRPEIFIELPVEGDAPREMCEFHVDQEVRIIGAPYHSMIGTILEFIPMPMVLPNKMKTRAAIIRLEDSRDVIIPLSNLDVIE